MKWVSTLVLLLAALVLFAFVFFYERKQPSSEEAAAQAKRLFTFEEKDVRWLEFDHDGTAVRIERAAARPSPGATGAPAGAVAPAPATGEAGWRVVRPITDRADGYLCDGLARRVAELEATRTFDAGARAPSDADAGLAPPRYRITFDAGAGAQTLLAGREAPATNGLFLRTPDGKTRLVPKTLVDGLDKPADEWRDHALFDFGAVELSAAEVIRPAGALRFRREKEDWRLVAPVEDDASGSRVQALLSSIASLRAEAFHPDSEAATAGLDQPAHRVRLTRRDGTVAELAIGLPVAGAADRVYARVAARAGIAEVPSRILTDLDSSADSYRSLRLFTVSSWDVRSLVLQAKGETVELKRPQTEASSPTGPAQWIAARPAGLTPRTESVESLVNDLTELEAAEIVGPARDLASFGLEPPVARAEITAAIPPSTLAGPGPDAGPAPAAAKPPAGTTQIVRFGKAAPGEGRVYALREGRGWILAVPAKILDRFTAASLK